MLCSAHLTAWRQVCCFQQDRNWGTSSQSQSSPFFLLFLTGLHPNSGKKTKVLAVPDELWSKDYLTPSTVWNWQLTAKHCYRGKDRTGLTQQHNPSSGHPSKTHLEKLPTHNSSTVLFWGECKPILFCIKPQQTESFLHCGHGVLKPTRCFARKWAPPRGHRWCFTTNASTQEARRCFQ